MLDNQERWQLLLAHFVTVRRRSAGKGSASASQVIGLKGIALPYSRHLRDDIHSSVLPVVQKQRSRG